jgi:F0F1-type ATP synthase assembly protein I
LTVGWYVSLSVIMPVGIGYWLDRPEMFNKSPLFTLVGLGVGTFISFFGLIQILLRYKREQDALNQKKEKKTE